MRVAFTPIGGDNWTGGYHYLKNLLTALGLSEILCVSRSMKSLTQHEPISELDGQLRFSSMP